MFESALQGQLRDCLPGGSDVGGCILLELRKHAPGEVSSREKQEPSLGAQEGVCAKAASS